MSTETIPHVDWLDALQKRLGRTFSASQRETLWFRGGITGRVYSADEVDEVLLFEDVAEGIAGTVKAAINDHVPAESRLTKYPRQAMLERIIEKLKPLV